MAKSEFPSNKKSDQPPEKEVKQVTQVVQGEVIRRKKPLGKKFAETFFGGSSAKTAWSYVFADILVPGAKDVFLDVFNSGMERMVLGETRRSRGRMGGRPGDPSYVSYNRMSGPTHRESHDTHRQQLSRRARANHDFDEIILPTRVEAEEVINRLYDLVSKYESATVADLYDLLGIDQKFVDDKWGWYELPGARVQRVRNGYLLDLPRPEPLE